MEQLEYEFYKEQTRRPQENLNLLLNRIHYINEIENSCKDFNQLDLLDGIRYSLPEFYNMRKPVFEDDDLGIVIQGPVVGEANLTWRIAELYRQVYPQAKIVISTWVGEGRKMQIDGNSGIDIIESNPPASDKRHVAHQLRSTYNGLRFLKQQYNVSYVLKTRTDQVFYKLDFLHHLKNLLKLHKPLGNKIKDRIIFCGHTSYFLPFFMGDFMTFSHIDILLDLYGEKYIPSESYDDMMERKQKLFTKLYFQFCGRNALLYHADEDNLKRWQKLCSRVFQFKGKLRGFGAETFIPMMFYSKHIGDLQYDKLLMQYWDFLARYCIVMGKDELQLYWPKYNNETTYKMNSVTYNAIDYAKWLNIYLEFREQVV